MRQFNVRDEILGIAIRLPFSSRDQNNSLYNLFFKKTLQKGKQGEAWHDIAVFPTNLKIQSKYLENIDQILFFTPDLSSIYEGFVFAIYSNDSKESIKDGTGQDLKKIIIQNSSFTMTENFKKWIIIKSLKKVELKDVQQYYVCGTNYSLADKLMEPFFPRVYYTDTAKTIPKKGSKYSFCPFCGMRLISGDFNYCPCCGSSLRITNN